MPLHYLEIVGIEIRDHQINLSQQNKHGQPSYLQCYVMCEYKVQFSLLDGFQKDYDNWHECGITINICDTFFDLGIERGPLGNSVISY